MILRASLLVCFATLAASPSSALSLADCTRTTHISHGGQADHRDLGEGRVMWRDWWSQEGTATNFTLVDCAPGTALRFRTAEDRMNARGTFDRTDKALDALAQFEQGARAFATFARMAAALEPFARDIEITILTSEPCACAALYADARGDKTPFALEGG